MKLNHLNLTVDDVPAAAVFLETYLGLVSQGGNAGMAFLTDDDGLVLSLMKRRRGDDAPYPGTFHVGFFVADEAAVDETHRRMTEGGVETPPPARHNHGYGFYVQAPGGFTVEVGA